MRRLLCAGILGLAMLHSPPARPCGGAFGPELEVPDMSILVSYREGVETYVFQPGFCGQASEFGILLPVPALLSSTPALGDPRLFAQLERLAAPTIVTRTECRDRSNGNWGGGGADAGAGDAGGTSVIDSGRVGIFDWTLLSADSSQAFTDWLDANGYPYEPGAVDDFDFYVYLGWYFVAFKVTASDKIVQPWERLCGTFGPIQVSFPTSAPVVPSRIASRGGNPGLLWTLFTIAAAPLATPNRQYVGSTLKYNGALTAEELADATTVAAYGQVGDRLVKTEVSFNAGLAPDLDLVESAAVDYREVVYQTVYQDCDWALEGCQGCTLSEQTPSGTRLALLGAALLALLLLRRRVSSDRPR